MTVTSSAYDHILRSVINAHKERQALTLTRVLSERLAMSVSALLAQQAYAVGARDIVLVPIPSAAATVRQRGFDATASMARLAVRRLRLKYPMTAQSVLVQGRPVADQAGLGARARHANLAGAFRQSGRGRAGVERGRSSGTGRRHSGRDRTPADRLFAD